MSMAKMLAGKNASLKSSITNAETAEGPHAEEDPNRARTGPGGILLAGEHIAKAKSEAKVALERVSELELEVQALMEQVKAKVDVAIDALVIVPGRRRKLTSAQFHALKENLAHNPLGSPISVRPLPSGKFELIAGHNRVEAYRQLGHASIPAAVLDLSDIEANKVAFYTNLVSPELPPFERYRGLKRRMDEDKLTQVAVAEESGLSAQSVSALMNFEKLAPELVALLEESDDVGRFTIEAAAAFSKVPVEKLPLALGLAKGVLDGTLTASTAIGRLVAPVVKAKAVPPSRQIKLGKKLACEISHRGRIFNIAFKSEDFIPDELLDEIHKLVEARMQSMSR